jgi:HK97 family phage major capsid protein
MSEAKEILTRLEARVEEFRKANDELSKQLKEKGSADTLLIEKVEKLNSSITELNSLKSEVEELQVKMNRPAVDPRGKQKSEDVIAHEKAFNQFVRKGDDRGLSDLERKAVNVTTAADGGYALPEEIDSQIYSLAQNFSRFRGLARVVRVSTSDYKQLINKHGATSGWVGEATARTETNSPAIDEFAPPMGEIYANPAATQRSLDDLSFDVEAWLAQEIADKFAIEEGVAFIGGNGTNKPKGITQYTTAATADSSRAYGIIEHILSGTSGTIATVEPLMDLLARTKEQHKINGTFLMNALTEAVFRKFKDANDNYIWQQSLQAGKPNTLLGYPVVVEANMPDLAANSLSIAFGDFKNAYTIVDRVGIRTLRDPLTNKPYVHFYSTKRVGGGVKDSEAIKFIKTTA